METEPKNEIQPGFIFNQKFIAKPQVNDDGSVNLMKWNCQIPGPKDV